MARSRVERVERRRRVPALASGERARDDDVIGVLELEVRIEALAQHLDHALAVGLASLIAAFLPRTAGRIGAGIGALAALAGLGVAGRHLWIIANPATSCGIDPLETALNTIPSARLMPFLFKADGLCTADYPPIFGLSIPLWAFLWFAGFAIVLIWTAWRARA